MGRVRQAHVATALVLCTSCHPAGAHVLYDVVEREVQFTNGDVRLAGTLVLPDADGKTPAIVLVHGSGPETRSMYLRYAREFAAAGIAAIAYDKRGAGKSSTNVSARAPFADLAKDAVAAVHLLKTIPSIDSTHIGIWGLSEGEWVAPLAASMMRAPAFVILVSASSVSPTRQVGLEQAIQLRAAGHPDSIVRLAELLHEGVARFQRTGEGRDALNAQLARYTNEQWFRDAEYLEPSLPPYDSLREQDWFPAWRANMDFDALEVLRGIEAPVLVLLGGKDGNNDARLSTERYLGKVGDSGGRTVTVRVFPEAGHALLEWWLPLRLPPPRYPKGYFEFQAEWIWLQLASGAPRVM